MHRLGSRSFTRCCAAAVIALLLGAPQHVAAQSPPPVTLTVATTPGDDVTPLLYAQQAGLFAKAGLDVHISKLTSGSAVTAAIISGAFQIGKSSIVSLMSAHLRDIHLTIIAPAGIYDSKSPFAMFLTNKDGPIHGGADLNGKIVSTPGLRDVGQLADSAWIDQHGGDSSSVHFVELPMSASGTALQERRIDATTIIEPDLGAALRSGQLRALGPSFGAIAPHFLFSAWFTQTDWATKNAEVVRKFAAVVTTAAAYTNAHHTETVALASAFTGIPVEVYAVTARAINGTELKAGDIQPVIDAAAKYHIIDHGFAAQELLAY